MRGPSRSARLVVAGLGIAMVPGYLGEKLVRRRLTRSGHDTLETPLVIAGVMLAALTALLGISSLRRGEPRAYRSSMHVVGDGLVLVTLRSKATS